MAPSQTRHSQAGEIAVIGGGITGLSAALKLRELAPQRNIRVLESDSRLGGVLGTEEHDGLLIEQSADMFTVGQPEALDLCKRLGFEGELMEPNQDHRRAFVVKGKRLLPVPDGLSLLGPSRILPLVTTRLLSPLDKLRMLGERWIAKKTSDEDESLADFTRRRLGKGAFDWLIQPLVGGIYTADPEKLSMRATLPQFLDMEQEHGSLIGGMRRKKKGRQADREASGARYGMFRAPRRGMRDLVRCLADNLPAESIHTGVRIQQIQQLGEGAWRVTADDHRHWDVEGLMLATPVNVTARLMRAVDERLAGDLDRIPLAGVVVAVLSVPRSQLSRPVDGFGFVVPMRANRKILACSFSSIKFAGRAPDDQVLMRVFVGGACQPELMLLDDNEISAIVWQELRDLLGLRGEPGFVRILRWQDRMPQYHVGHVELVDEIERAVARLPRLEIAGNAYRGVGIPFCVRSGEQAAQRLFDQISRQ